MREGDQYNFYQNLAKHNKKKQQQYTAYIIHKYHKSAYNFVTIVVTSTFGILK